MKDKGLALLLLIAAVGFMVWTATSRANRVGMRATRSEKAESIAPLGNQPVMPDREPFTVGYERREEVHTPMTPMPQIVMESCPPPAVSTTETVAVSCEGGDCEYKESPIPQVQAPMQAPVPPVSLIPSEQAPIPQEIQAQPPIPQEMQAQPPMPSVQAQPPIPHPEMQAHHPIPPVQAPIHQEMQAREGFGPVARRRAVRDISHSNPFMR